MFYSLACWLSRVCFQRFFLRIHTEILVLYWPVVPAFAHRRSFLTFGDPSGASIGLNAPDTWGSLRGLLTYHRLLAHLLQI